MSQPNAIYFPEGAGYLLVQVLQSINDCSCIESNVMLVRSLEDNKLYIRKTISLTSQSLSRIPNEIEFNPSFHLIPCVKDITKFMDKQSGEYYWAICTEYCNLGDLRNLLKTYDTEAPDQVSEPLIWKFIADMIEILGFLRAQKINHNDISPQNVFMRYDPEKSDTFWPDFVLGNFGWAVAMDDKNFRKDRWLFLQLLWDLCVSEECNIQLCMLDHRHLSEELRITVKYL
jgi:serine/threonine protein kinase